MFFSRKQDNSFSQAGTFLVSNIVKEDFQSDYSFILKKISFLEKTIF